MFNKNYTFGERETGFTLVELLVVISIITLLVSILLPSIRMAKNQAKGIVCASNLAQLSFAFACYCDDYNGYAMPTRGGGGVFWWGQKNLAGIDHKKGFIWPYLRSELHEKSVFECPLQKYGTYQLQAKPPGFPEDPKWISSTYGYNGYYLSPPQSGWWDIRDKPWQKITNVIRPEQVIAFADTMIDYDLTGTNPILKNTALLDPPYLYKQGTWEVNPNPTTCFRHNDKVNVVFISGSCKSMKLEDGELTSPKAKIGSITKSNAPYYVPNYRSW